MCMFLGPNECVLACLDETEIDAKGFERVECELGYKAK
jgi:hypothetical protein